MARAIVLFEDEGVSNLYPLTLTRSVFDLRCGALTILEKLQKLLERYDGTRWWAAEGERVLIFAHVRSYLSEYLKARGFLSSLKIGGNFDGITLINGRVLPTSRLLEEINPQWEGKYVCNGTVVAVNLGDNFQHLMKNYSGKPLANDAFRDLAERSIEAKIITYPWDLVRHNGAEIESDFEILVDATIEGSERLRVPEGVHLIGEDVILGKGTKIGPGVVIDASDGPVLIDDEAVIMPNASLRGPLYIGKKSMIKMGARIYGETSIGPVSKVGGEVAESIIHGYSNKQHSGFLGHSYLGEWVNIGAGTNTSDMKNNYSTVRVSVNGSPIDTGELFVGLFMGDHSKCGIGTVFNTGTVVGVCCNIFGGDYPPKFIPSFSWGGTSGFTEHKLEKAIETARRAMARRDRQLDKMTEDILRSVFEDTKDERLTFLSAHSM